MRCLSHTIIYSKLTEMPPKEIAATNAHYCRYRNPITPVQHRDGITAFGQSFADIAWLKTNLVYLFSNFLGRLFNAMGNKHAELLYLRILCTNR